MTSEYNAAQRLLHKVKQGVSDFELGKYNDELVIKAAIVQDLQTLSKRITEYRLIGRQETGERKRTMMLDRATTMADEHELLKRRYDKLKQRKQEQALYQESRQELFQRSQQQQSVGREPMETAIVMDPQMEDGFWGRSEMAVDGFIAQGMASLDNLREQRGLLQGAHRRILNADNTLGLSRSVITYINRRTTQDKIFLAGGMFATCVLIYFIIHYFG
ncbi:protein transport protein bos1 [Coemansia sp. RSA 1722]|nr:protein transport protein bos1 [Coemansia sp. RSA 486]KAJ2235728.1 protein transport protein bos1 [Coemansia sp. RSA 485]KAJ2594698.1 protein transport protein bos1 [Coemansia sp. RSA 1721]KAJ2603728.1 protein transport protein bos1 [Coemansia sp. RSA 1722]KAJ2702940.1 protein transport protein bos1 [Coemansia sp. IMI 203386]